MLQIRIVSNNGTVYEDKVVHATFPGELGSFAIYPMHAPIISTLVAGNIACFTAGGEKKTIPVRSGFVEVSADRITACIE